MATTSPDRRKAPARMAERIKAFAEAYIVDLNAKNAALAAGYAERAAKQAGYAAMKDPRFVAAVELAMAERMARTQITADEVLRNIVRIGNSAERKGKLEAALRAQELLGKHLKMFTDKIEHGAIGGGPIVMHVTTTDENL